MTIDLLKDEGTPLEKQSFSWRELVQEPYSKLDDDAFTRVRVILMNGIEAEALRFGHAFARMNREHREALARVRRVEQHQQTLVNWLNPPDQTPIETTIGFEQVAIEVTAMVAQHEPDPYLKQVYDFGLLEDFDHMYRYAALYDRVEGKDAGYLLQGYTDILPGRPTSLEHRHPADDLREPYACKSADPISKLNALTIMSGEHMTHDFYMTIGPMFADPLARQLYAEIASIEEQHVTQYESIIDPDETWLEKWLLHEACEVYNYASCVETEGNPRIKKIWERMLDYELGQLRFVEKLFQKHENRDAAEVLPEKLPELLGYDTQRSYVRRVLREQVDLRADGATFVSLDAEPQRSIAYRERLNADGSPSDSVSASYVWHRGTELADKGDGERRDHVQRVEGRA